MLSKNTTVQLELLNEADYSFQITEQPMLEIVEKLIIKFEQQKKFRKRRGRLGGEQLELNLGL